MPDFRFGSVDAVNPLHVVRVFGSELYHAGRPRRINWAPLQSGAVEGCGAGVALQSRARSGGRRSVLCGAAWSEVSGTTQRTFKAALGGPAYFAPGCSAQNAPPPSTACAAL